MEPLDSQYPVNYDTVRNMLHAVPDLETTVSTSFGLSNFSVEHDDNSVGVKSTMGAPANGYFTVVHSDFGDEGVSSRFYYTGKTSNSFEGVSLARDSQLFDFPVGSKVYFNCVAQHHNQLVSGTRSSVGYIGSRAASLFQDPVDDGSLSYQADVVYRKVHRPVPWFSVDRHRPFVGEKVTFTDKTSRILNEDNLDYYWEFGDDTFIRERRSNGTWYRQEIFGDGAQSPERATVGRQPIIKAYDKPGIYTVRLTVGNDVGQNSISVTAAVSVLGRAPAGANVHAKSTRAFVGDSIRVDGTVRFRDPDNPIIRWQWNFYDDYDRDYPNSPNINFVPYKGGIVPVTLRLYTESGNFSRQHSPRFVDITESPSVWLLANNPGGSELFPKEYSPIAGAWKAFSPDPNYFVVDSVANASVNRGSAEFNANHSKGFHARPRHRDLDSYVFRSDSPGRNVPQDIVVKRWTGFTYTWSTGGAYPVDWNWQTLHCPGDNDSLVYIFGQESEQNGIVERRAKTFDMTSETFQESGIFDLSQSPNLASKPGAMVRRHAAVGSRVFVMSGQYGERISDLSAFSPSSAAFQRMSEPINFRSSTDMAAANFKLWTYDPDEQQMYTYDTIADLWAVGPKPPENIMLAAHGIDRRDLDEPGLDIVMRSEHSGTFHNSVFMMWPYEQSANIEFNAISGSFTRLPQRPDPSSIFEVGVW